MFNDFKRLIVQYNRLNKNKKDVSNIINFSHVAGGGVVKVY